MSRIKFPTHAKEWTKCMEMCPKYQRAIVPFFTTQEEMEELRSWLYKITTDPISGTNFPDVIGKPVWVPFRLELFLINYITF